MFEKITSIEELNKAMSNLAFFGTVNEHVNEEYKIAKDRILSQSKASFTKIEREQVSLAGKEMVGNEKCLFSNEDPMEIWIDV